MPLKKAGAAAAASSTASGTAVPVRLRKKTSTNLNGSANGGEASPAPAASSTTLATTASLKKPATKTRTSVTSTSITAQQAALTSSSPPIAAGTTAAATTTASGPRTRASASGHVDSHPSPSATVATLAPPAKQAAAASSSGAHSHVGTATPTQSRKNSSTPAAAKAASSAAAKSRASTVSSQTTAAVVSPDPPPPPPPAAAAPSPKLRTTPHVAASSSTGSSSTAAPVVRRQRGNIGAAATSTSGAGSAAPAATAASSTVASPVPVLRAARPSASVTSTPPPVSHRSDPSSRSGPPTPIAGSTGIAASHSTTTTMGARPHRSSAIAHADTPKAALDPAPTASAKTSTSPLPQQESAEVKRDGREHGHNSSGTTASLPARKRGSTGTAFSIRTKTSATETAHASAERGVKKKVMRRSSDGGTAAAPTSTYPSSTLASRRSSARGSVSGPATAASTAPPTRDPSVAQPPQQQLQQHGNPCTSRAVETESFMSTALNTARESASEFESSAISTTATTPNNMVASLSNLPRRSHGPVVSEEWARSIIKPGDEHLLYVPANAAFARTPSGTSVNGSRGAASVARKGGASSYDPELRRAQQTLLKQRYIATPTPTPGRRSTKGATISTSVAASVASGGSGSRLGSTVRRSGTRLQQLRHEAEERQRSLNAALSTPKNDDGSAVRACGSTVDPGTGGHTPASPTPSRMSEASTNTGVGAGGRISAGTPMSRRSTGSNEVPIDNIPGAASVVGGAFRNTPPGAGGQQQRGSPSLALFARPSPRIFAAPSPRGSTGASGVPGKMVTFGVSNNAPYYTGNEELTKLTRVREDMLRALFLSSTTSATPETGVKAKEEGSSASPPLSKSASSPLTAHADPCGGDAATTPGGASPTATKRLRQRIYGVDIRPGANGEAVVSPQKAPAADVSKPRGRVSSSSADAILVSSIRQKPSTAIRAAKTTPQLSPSRSPTAAAATGSAAANAATAARPKLSVTALGSADPSFSATNSATRLPRRAAVTVTLANLQPANVLGERVCAELMRQSEQTRKDSEVPRVDSSTQAATAAAPAAPAAAAPWRSGFISFEEATRRLLLDPFFPLVSEENYQRLVLQNDEYNERKALIVRICATPPPPPQPSLLLYGGTAAADDGDGGQPRRSGTVGPKAARALEMDLAEADEITVAAVEATAAPALHTPFSFTTTSPRSGANSASTNNITTASNSSGGGGVAAVAAAVPRRPSVQYGGPTAYTSPQSLARSPSPGAQPASPPSAASLSVPSAPSPARDGKLLVNAVMPSEKTGPIKPLALSNVWYNPPMTPAEAAVQPGASQTMPSSSNLSNGPGTSVGSNSPLRAHSRSPSASRSSSRHTPRRGSLLHSAQQQSMSAAALVSQSVSSDSESTASDEVVDEAEAVLRRALPRWGPFRIASQTTPPPELTAAAAAATSSTRQRRSSASTSTTSATSSHNAGWKGKKVGDNKSAGAWLKEVAPSSSMSVSAISALPPLMLDELEAYVHFFLKRFRGADAATTAEIGTVPDTPLALQRAIRQSLRLSCGSVASGSGDGSGDAEDVEGVATELQDPLDDGSYHSQNVQYVLDLLGSLLQMQDSFCEDVVVGGGRAAARAAGRGFATQHSKAKLTEADFLATVMWHPALNKSGEQGNTDDDAQKTVVGGTITRTVHKSVARPMLKLHDPELRAVELMFANTGGAAAAKSETAAEATS